jgi:hypothetical protein
VTNDPKRCLRLKEKKVKSLPTLSKDLGNFDTRTFSMLEAVGEVPKFTQTTQKRPQNRRFPPISVLSLTPLKIADRPKIIPAVLDSRRKFRAELF